MPSHPPPTPWLPTSRFADESLLLTTQPIFGDVSLGEESISDWAQSVHDLDDDAAAERDTPVPSSFRSPDLFLELPQPDRPDTTLDLGSYLPDGDTSQNASRPSRTGHITQAEWESTPVPRVAHKRDASVTLTADMPLKRPKPHVISTNEMKDDLYSRRLSDSNRRSSSSSLSPMLPSLIVPTPTSSLFASSASSSITSSSATSAQLRPVPPSTGLLKEDGRRINTASARLKESIRRPVGIVVEKKTMDEATEQDGKRDTVSRTTVTSSSTNQPPSALARFLAKSTVANPIKVTPITPPSEPQSASRLECTPLPLHGISQIPGSSSATPRPSHQPHHEDPWPARALPNNTSDEPSAHPTVSVASDTSSVDSSRRSSMSGKVVGFISGLMRSVSSSSLKEQVSASKETKKVFSEDLDAAVTDEEATSTIQRHSEGRTAGQEVRGRQTGPKITKQSRPPVPTLTRPIPFSRPLHVPSRPREPLQISRAQPAGPSRSVPPVKPPAKAKAVATSAFASAALARLPPPGKGHASAAKPVEVKPNERAKDLGRRRGVFERLSTTSKPPVPPASATRPHATGITRTVPISGRTPGKASQIRAQQRSRFDTAVRERIEEKERLAKEEARRIEAEEEERYRQSRKETVIWAKPVPDMYHHA